MDEDTKKEIHNITEISKKNRQLSLTEKAANAIADKITSKNKIALSERLKQLTVEQKEELQQIEDRAIASHAGSLDDLESALGMLRIGHHMGWKVLYIIHSKKTIRKYEEILNIRIREIFDEKGPSAGRSVGLELAEKLSNFWKVVSGEKGFQIDTSARKKIT